MFGDLDWPLKRVARVCQHQLSFFLYSKRTTLGGGYNYDPTTIRLRFDQRSTPIRLQFDRATTIRRPTLDRKRTCVRAAAPGSK